jgi:hypothetical protein
MKHPRLTRIWHFSLVGIASLGVLWIVPPTRTHAANAGPTLPAGAPKPLVNLKSRQTLQFTYAGSQDAVAALRAGTVTPAALAAADFDADGAMDVVAGYSMGSAGVLAVLRGNPEAYAPKDLSLYKKALQGSLPATFLSKASVIALPESPDLLVTGDFNRDGHVDVLVAARGGALYFLAGDGHGNLLAPTVVPVLGQVRALAADAAGHVAVSLESSTREGLAIFSPSAEGLAPLATFPLPARGNSIAWGSLGGSSDIAVAAGSNVTIIYNALTPKPQTETITVPFSVQAIALGDYIWDQSARTEIAALADDGSIQILQHGVLNTAPLTGAQLQGRRAIFSAKNLKSLRNQPSNPTALGAWTVAKQLASSISASTGPLSPSAFSTPRLAATPTHDLMVLDAGRNQLNIFDTSGTAASPTAAVSFSGAPVAALALPQKINAVRDIVVLTSSQSAPMLITALGSATLNVNTTADVDSVNACATNSTVTSPPSTLSLREAVCIANNNGAGTYTINVPAGIYDLAISTYGGNGSESSGGELQVGITAGTNVTISGAGQTSTIIQQTNGKDRLIEQDQLVAGNISITLQYLTLTGGLCDDSTGLDCEYNGGGAILGGAPGDNMTITNVTLSNNESNPSTTDDYAENGGAISYVGGDLTITGSTFTSNKASAYGGGLYAEVGYSDGNIPSNFIITNSTFTNNIALFDNATNNDGSGGGIDFDLAGGYPASITGSSFTGNQVLTNNVNEEGGAILAEGGSSDTFSMSNSRIVGNVAPGGGTGAYLLYLTPTLNNNWWGCNAGPNASGCDSILQDVSGTNEPYNPSTWLVLSIGASPTQVLPDGTSTLTADLTHDSNANGGFSVPDGTGVAFGATLGTDNPTSSIFTSGQATSTFTAGAPTGAGSGTATVDNQTVSVTINVMQSTTSTSVSSSLSPSAYGQSVTLTATVSSSAGTPTGTVTFKNGSVTLGNKVTLVGGVATLTTSALHLGTESITAAYFGSAKYSGSTSSPLGQMVNPATTTVGLTSSPNPSTVGQSVMFTATVAPQFSGTPQGKVKFMNGTKALGTVTLAGGMATLSKPFLGAGTKSITAVFFSGSADFSGSTSPILSQVVN